MTSILIPNKTWNVMTLKDFSYNTEWQERTISHLYKTGGFYRCLNAKLRNYLKICPLPTNFEWTEN